MSIEINHETNDISATASGSVTIDGATPGGGASTAYGAVGTYVNGTVHSGTNHARGDTVSGSSVGLYEMVTGDNISNSSNVGTNISGQTTSSSALSGTWRWMSESTRGGTISRAGLLVRIS